MLRLSFLIILLLVPLAYAELDTQKFNYTFVNNTFVLYNDLNVKVFTLGEGNVDLMFNWTCQDIFNQTLFDLRALYDNMSKGVNVKCNLDQTSVTSNLSASFVGEMETLSGQLSSVVEDVGECMGFAEKYNECEKNSLSCNLSEDLCDSKIYYKDEVIEDLKQSNKTKIYIIFIFLIMCCVMGVIIANGGDIKAIEFWKK